jgi:nitrogen-specific signal transduction histidine kinase
VPRRTRSQDAEVSSGEQDVPDQAEHGLLASVCHDVQQPLTVILGQVQLLQRQLARGQPLEAERLGTRLAHIFAAATRMRDITQDLVDMSLHESGRPLALVLARTELVALTRQAVGEHELVSHAHQFLFEAEVPILEATVDETRVHRVLANLLSNAVKYSPDGGPVHVTFKPLDGPDGRSALLSLRDEGVGIPPDDLPHVFDRFHRGANVVGRFAGSGLGLASARELVELHGGAISVESQDGKGSMFVVRLPLAPPAARASLPTTQPLGQLNAPREAGFDTLVAQTAQVTERHIPASRPPRRNGQAAPVAGAAGLAVGRRWPGFQAPRRAGWPLQVQLLAQVQVAHDVAAAQHADQHAVLNDWELVDTVGHHQLESSRARSRSASGATVLSGMAVITVPTDVVLHAVCVTRPELERVARAASPRRARLGVSRVEHQGRPGASQLGSTRARECRRDGAQAGRAPATRPPIRR